VFLNPARGFAVQRALHVVTLVGQDLAR
jgi:hypothetical protein